MDTTLLKGLTVLEALINSGRPRGVSEFAVELGLTKSNVYRVLKTLQVAGYVQQMVDATTYSPTLKAWELGSRIYADLDITREARPHLVRLAGTTRETIHLSILDGGEVVYVDKIDSPEPVRAYSIVGGRAPAHCVATGKVLLAFSAEEVVAFERFTPRTITGMTDFATSCSDVRAKGYAVNWGEWRESVRGVAAPVRDGFGAVIAAVGVSGPAERLTRARIVECTLHVVQTADDISQALGFVRKRRPVEMRG